MKKISILTAMAAVVLGLSSCSNDAEPVFQKPTEFKLNTPPMAEQYYELTPGGSMTFTVSQPDYGFTASTTYGIQIALSEGGDTYDVAPLTPTSAQIRVNAAEVATGITELYGATYGEKWDGHALPLFVRATAQLGSHGESFIASNWIQLKQVKGYYAKREPGFIYLVGTPSGWTGPEAANETFYADYRLYEKEDAIGSKVYWGMFQMDAAPIFRFYSALTGWDGGASMGYMVDDAATDFTFGDGTSITETVISGKGSYSFPDFPGGEMTIIVDLNAEKVTFLEGNQM